MCGSGRWQTLLVAIALSFGVTARPAEGAAPGLPVLSESQSVPALRPASPPAPTSWTLQYEQRFLSAAALEDFVMTDPSAWLFAPGTPQGALELAQQSRYSPPVRSPVNIALIADRQFGDFVLECDLLQTGREYGHRDMCLFFGLQNPTNFYYVHLATAADDHAHNIFIVKNAPRTKIAKRTTSGVDWGLNIWHRVRLERKIDEGLIKVWYDDLSEPIMIAEDSTFASGHIGFGSFDDTGRIANIRIWAPRMDQTKTDFYKRP
jgi:hypothetical protein